MAKKMNKVRYNFYFMSQWETWSVANQYDTHPLFLCILHSNCIFEDGCVYRLDGAQNGRSLGHTEPRMDEAEDGRSRGQDGARDAGVPRSGGNDEGMEHRMISRSQG